MAEPAVVVVTTPWLTLAEAATYARVSEEHLRRALASGECVGSQNGERGAWTVHTAHLDAWKLGVQPPSIVEPVTARVEVRRRRQRLPAA